jgi:hypothetical protein
LTDPTFALVDAHVHLWTELIDAAGAGDDDISRIALAAWRPAVAAIEALMPRIAGPMDNWDFEAAACGLVNAIDRRRFRRGGAPPPKPRASSHPPVFTAPALFAPWHARQRRERPPVFDTAPKSF